MGGSGLVNKDFCSGIAKFAKVEYLCLICVSLAYPESVFVMV